MTVLRNVPNEPVVILGELEAQFALEQKVAERLRDCCTRHDTDIQPLQDFQLLNLLIRPWQLEVLDHSLGGREEPDAVADNRPTG